MGRLVALLSALLAGGLIAWAGERTPPPLPADATAAAFSAVRARADVEAMSARPRPMASPQAAAVRDHLFARLAELGLTPQLRPGVGLARRDGLVGGRVENILGIAPGRDRKGPAVMLMAHYDSVPGSPGAADDAAGVATALEVIRAIRSRGIPARDVMVLLTDGEEVGLLGANAFFRRDPSARRVGLVVNLEARGSSGKTRMFQTSAENGGLVDLFRTTAIKPASSSLAVFVYRLMPNDTDLSEALAAGVPGLNYAFVGGQFDYHAATATAANLDSGALQHLGDQTLAMTAAAAFAPALPGRRSDAAYSQVFGDLIIAYPAWAGWLVLLAAAGMWAIGLRRARRLEPVTISDLARGGAALLFAAMGAVVVLQFARRATGAQFGYLEQRPLLAHAGPWEVAVVLLALGFLLLAAAELARGRRAVAIVPLLAGAGASAFGAFDPLALGAGVGGAAVAMIAFGRPVGRPASWAGVAIAGLALALAVQAFAPTAAFVLAWPLLLAGVGAAATACAARREHPHLALLAGLAAVGVGWSGAFVHAAFLGMDFMPLQVLPVLMAAPLLWPLAQPAEGAPPERWIGAGLLLAGLGVTAFIRFADPYDARHPQATQVLYHLDQDTRRGWRVSLTPDLPAWSRDILGADGGKVAAYRHWLWRRPVDAAPAAYFVAPGPQVSLWPRADGSLALRAAPPPGGRAVELYLQPSGEMSVTSIGGLPVADRLPPKRWTSIRWTDPGGVEVFLAPSRRGFLDVRAASLQPAWPAAARPLPPRPTDLMAWDESDGTIVSLTRRFAWRGDRRYPDAP